MYWDMLYADDCLSTCTKLKSEMWLYEYESKHLDEMRRDNREYVLHSLYCVHDNKGLILNDNCYGTNALLFFLVLLFNFL